MRAIWRVLFIGVLAIVLAGWAGNANAQLGGLKKKVKEKVEKKADEKTDEKIDEALDKATGEGEEEQEGEKTPQAEEKTAGGQAAGSADETETLKPGQGVWLNYDFIPGDQILFFEDFSKSPVGDFPQRLEFVEGNMEVAEWNATRWLRASTEGDFNIPLPEVLPQRFTVELDYWGPTGANTVEIKDGTDQSRNDSRVELWWNLSSGIRGETGGKAESDMPEKVKKRVSHCRLMGDGKYLKVYINETRVANVPNATFGRAKMLQIHVWAEEDKPLMLTNFRIAAGGKKILYDALMADGRVATQGIYFDSGSDRLRPESTPTLKEIGTMLKEHADLKLLIEGHTDNVGEDASNQTLSDKRAAAVKAYLVSTYGIDTARLQTKGFGETKPVGSNDTPEGRQNNRRVELVKL